MVGISRSRNIAVVTLTVALSAVAVAGDHASKATLNYQSPSATPWLIRVGYNGLTATTGRDLTAQNGIELAFGRSLGQVGLLGMNSEAFVELFAAINRGNSSGTGDRIGAAFIERKMLQVGHGGRGFYAGYGAGLQIVRVKGRYGPPAAGNGGGSNPGSSYQIHTPVRFNSTGRFGADTTGASVHGRVLFGYQFNPTSLAEIALNFGPKVDGVSTDSVSLSFGIRF
jgi:hypothetical protein